MFAGIIENMGEIVGLKAGRMTMRCRPWPTPLRRGESIAVNGVCLTLTAWKKNDLFFDLLAETLKRTNLGEKRRGQHVNLERSRRVGDSIGGHFVTGHVDGKGRVRSVKRVKRDWILEISCSKKLMAGMVEKGSIAVDGVSLTVVDVFKDGFTVHLIPHTWKETSLSELRVGDAVNLETDMIGKYVLRYAELMK
jgi:riboflavin synthase